MTVILSWYLAEINLILYSGTIIVYIQIHVCIKVVASDDFSGGLVV